MIVNRIAQVSSMRELVLKNLLSNDHKKKEVFLCESYEKEGYIQRLEKQSIYIVEDIIQIKGNFEVDEYLEKKKHDGMLKPKHTYIVKRHDSEKNEDRFTYKICGDLYAIVEDKLYLIRLKQCLKVEFVKGKDKH